MSVPVFLAHCLCKRNKRFNSTFNSQVTPIKKDLSYAYLGPFHILKKQVQKNWKWLKKALKFAKALLQFSFWSKHETTLAYDLLLVTPRRKSALTAIGDAVLCGPPERAPRVGPPPPTLTWKAHLKCTALPYRASQLKHKGRRHV